MPPPSTFRETAHKVAIVALSMTFGALLLAIYLEHRYPDPALSFRQLRIDLMVALSGINAVQALLRPADGAFPHPEPSPRWSGVFAVAATGIVAIFARPNGFDMRAWGWADTAIAIATAAIAIAVWRFATRHAHSIGEARFTTTNAHPNTAAQ